VIAQHLFEKINCPTQKRNCLNQLNPFFEQFLFFESRIMTAQITSAQITTA
jgi:hypothetical protein